MPAAPGAYFHTLAQYRTSVVLGVRTFLEKKSKMIGLVFRVRVSFSDVFFQWFCTVQGYGNTRPGVPSGI